MSVRKFETLTRNGQRVRIAKDVIKQLDSKKLVAMPGSYLSPFVSEVRDVYGTGRINYFGEVNIRNIPVGELKEKVTCKVCALGALLCGAASFKLITSSYNSFAQDNTRDNLSDYFSEKELMEIEYYFEGGNVTVGNLGYIDSEMLCRKYDKYGTSDERIRALMNNIIANRGAIKWETV